MADGTKIEWTDATWNIVNGCSVLSPGCTNCYAMKLAGTRLKHVESRKGLTIDTKAGPVWNGTTKFNEPVLLDPIRWKRPRKIFVCAHGDLFHESVPDEWIDKVFAVMALAPQHQFQVLTKRSARMRRYMESIDNGDGERLSGFRDALIEGMAQSIYFERTKDSTVDEWLAVHLPLPNVWLGVSVEDQQRANERIPDLLATPAALHWLSLEPLLGEVDLTRILVPDWAAGKYAGHGHTFNALRAEDDLTLFNAPNHIGWGVVGGESGPRPMHPDWARRLRNQFFEYDVPCLFKQWGSWAPVSDGDRCISVDGRNMPNLEPAGSNGDGTVRIRKLGKKAAGRLLDGVEHNGYPS